MQLKANSEYMEAIVHLEILGNYDLTALGVNILLDFLSGVKDVSPLIQGD